jgi:hypothetical protein
MGGETCERTLFSKYIENMLKIKERVSCSILKRRRVLEAGLRTGMPMTGEL